MELLAIVFDIILIWLFYCLCRWIYRGFKQFHISQSASDLQALSIKEPFNPPEIMLPYRRRDYLLTPAEKQFYDVLKPLAEENNCEVFAKVRLEDLLWIPIYTRNLLKWRGYIRSRHIDFLLCDKQSLRSLCAIELDDSSHNQPAVIRRDKIVDSILGSAGLPLLRIRAAYSYNADEISKLIAGKIRVGNTRIPTPAGILG